MISPPIFLALFTSLALATPTAMVNQKRASNDNIAYITDVNTFCMIMPRDAHTDIGDSEHPGGMQTYCSPNGRYDEVLQGLLPADFWRNVELNTNPGINGARVAQLTGCINSASVSQLNPLDGGGQYDSSGGDSGLGNPQYSVCLGYNHFVEIVEPAGPRACIRCCDDPADCVVTRDTEGCVAVIPGNYFDCAY